MLLEGWGILDAFHAASGARQRGLFLTLVFSVLLDIPVIAAIQEVKKKKMHVKRLEWTSAEAGPTQQPPREHA